jgi:hypothetical protein
LSSKRTFVAANHMLEGKQDPGPGKVKKGKPLKRDSQRKRYKRFGPARLKGQEAGPQECVGLNRLSEDRPTAWFGPVRNSHVTSEVLSQ